MKVTVCNETISLPSSFIHMQCTHDDETGLIFVNIPLKLRGALCLATLTYSTTPCILSLKFDGQSQFEPFKKAVDRWNDGEMEHIRQGELGGASAFKLKAVNYNNQNVDWLMTSVDEVFQFLLHGTRPKLTVFDAHRKTSESIRPNGDLDYMGITLSTLNSPKTAPSAVFSSRNSIEWVNRASLEQWGLRTNEDGSEEFIKLPTRRKSTARVVKKIKKTK